MIILDTWAPLKRQPNVTFWLGWSSWCDSEPVRLLSLVLTRSGPEGLPRAATSPAVPSAALAPPVQGVSLQEWGNSQISNTLAVSITYKGQGQNGTQTQLKMHKNNDVGKSKWKSGHGKEALKDLKDFPNYKLFIVYINIYKLYCTVLCYPVLFFSLSFFFLAVSFNLSLISGYLLMLLLVFCKDFRQLLKKIPLNFREYYLLLFCSITWFL